MLAAKTTLPVIGVPIPTKHLGGLDSLLSIVQMPRGIPVATVAIGNATNAGLLAASILALGDEALADRLAAWREQQTASVMDDPSNAVEARPQFVTTAAWARGSTRCSARCRPTSIAVLIATRIATAAAGAPVNMTAMAPKMIVRCSATSRR